MNKFLLILVNDGKDNAANNALNAMFQGYKHHAVDSIFECWGASGCPYPVTSNMQTPVVKFMLKLGKDKYREVDTLSDPVTSDRITQKLDALVNKTFEEGQGGDGIIPTDNPGKALLGLGLLDLGKLPPWVWLIVMALAGYKAATAKKQRCQIVFGTAALAAGFAYWNARNRSK